MATSKVSSGIKPLGYVAKANQYIADILSGKIPACEWVRLACQRQVEDLNRSTKNPLAFPYRFDVWAAERVCLFVEQLTHVEGEKTGQKAILEPWQCFFLTIVFGWLHAFDDAAKGVKAGKRRFRRVYMEVPRGNGKSFLSAAVELYMMCADGEGGAQCYVLATSVDQGDAVYRIAELMVKANPELQHEYGVQVAYLRITHPPSNSFIRALPNKRDGKLDSLNIHLAVADELHAHDVPDAFLSLKSGMGKRVQSLLWSITTAGSNQAGICFEEHKYVKELLQGNATNESFFGVIYSIDDKDDWKDPQCWIKANPNWNVSVSPVVIANSAAEAVATPAKQADFQTKHLNVWVGADQAWMNMVRWNTCRDTTLRLEDFKDDECIVGLDLASRRDLAAAVRVFRKFNEDDGKTHYYVFGAYWLPEQSPTIKDVAGVKGWVADGSIATTDGDTTNFDQIEEYIDEIYSHFHVKEIAYDAWMASQLVTHLQQTFGEDIAVAVPMGNTKAMSQAAKEVEALVFEGRLHHNDEVLTWNISNAVGHYDENGNIKPKKGNKNDPNCKIDAAIAMLMAVYRWTAYAEDESAAEASIFFI